MDHDIDIIRPDLPRGGFRSVLFDFDGTLSLIREGWQGVMVPMMVEVLRQTGTAEDPARLAEVVEDFVIRLTGKQTIYQMIQLAQEVRQRGGQPLDPLAYKRRYHDLLQERIGGRIEALQSGSARPVDWLVPGSLELLANLQKRGLVLYLASGTDLAFVRQEADLLGLTPFFGERIFGALDDYQKFSKQRVIEDILRLHRLEGEKLLAFGDGYVEIEEIKRVGGTAVAVATEEAKRQGVNPWKRQRLIGAGADLVIADFRCQERLVQVLFGEK